MGIKIEMLRCFATVAECGSLASAAARLNRSPAAVSMTLKQLEDHLGKALFESDRKSTLSAVGCFVLEQAQNELRQFDNTIHTIESYAKGDTGMVHIASVPSVAGLFLPQVLEQFIMRYPRVQIDLQDMSSSSVLRELQRNRVDIGIATVPDNIQTSHHTPLLSDEFGLVCSHSHALGKTSSPMKWAELQGETFIANALCSTIRSDAFQSIYRQANLKVHNIVSLLAMVKAGLGVTILPRMVLRLHPGEVVFRSLEDRKARRQIHMLTSANRIASPAVDTLSQMICETVGIGANAGN